jgi:DNA adenine methylase
MTEHQQKYRPFLKWPGNKYRCLEHILPRLPKTGRLIEPFTGSGAIFVNTHFSEYILGEKNPHLVHLYMHLQEEGTGFIEFCRQWFQPQFNDKKKYYSLRDEFNYSTDLKQKSALFLYLNRHGFNGLCRFNSKGFYNVPFGTYIKPYFPHKEMLHFYEKSKQSTFIYCDFEECFKHAKKGDVIYCDPPYHPISKTSNFTLYTGNEFNQQTQLKLAELAMNASLQGIHVLISNHDTAFTQELYQNANKIHSFEVSRSIASQGHKRIKVKEILAHFEAK